MLHPVSVSPSTHFIPFHSTPLELVAPFHLPRLTCCHPLLVSVFFLLFFLLQLLGAASRSSSVSSAVPSFLPVTFLASRCFVDDEHEVVEEAQD